MEEGCSPIETLRKEACEELHAGSARPHILGGSEDGQVVLSIRAASNLGSAEDIADTLMKNKTPFMTTILLVGSRIQDRAMREGLDRLNRNAGGVSAFNKPSFRLVGGELSNKVESQKNPNIQNNVKALCKFFMNLKERQGSCLGKDRESFNVNWNDSPSMSWAHLSRLMSRMSELTETGAVGGTSVEEMGDLLATLADAGKGAVKAKGYAPMTIKDLDKHLESPNYKAFMNDEPIDTVPMSIGPGGA